MSTEVHCINLVLNSSFVSIRLVLEQISKLEDDRKCWRLINGILFEKTKAEVVPDLQTMISNLSMVQKQINTTLVSMKQEMIQLEQAYSSIMEQAKKRNNQQLT